MQSWSSCSCCRLRCGLFCPLEDHFDLACWDMYCRTQSLKPEILISVYSIMFLKLTFYFILCYNIWLHLCVNMSCSEMSSVIFRGFFMSSKLPEFTSDITLQILGPLVNSTLCNDVCYFLVFDITLQASYVHVFWVLPLNLCYVLKYMCMFFIHCVVGDFPAQVHEMVQHFLMTQWHQWLYCQCSGW
jgi:hypothetical protein